MDDKMDANIKWAGFWIRVAATLIDSLVLLPFIGINVYNMYQMKSLPLALLIVLVMSFYKPFMEYRYSATLGKMAVNIKVVNKDLKKISWSQSVLRYSPWLIGLVFTVYTYVILFGHPDFMRAKDIIEVGTLQNELVSPALNLIGTMAVIISSLFVAFTKTKQGLHDMIASTYCIYKSS